MKLLNITVRNIVGLVVILAVAAVMLQLVRGQTQTPLTTQSVTATNTPLPANTPPPTETNTPPISNPTPFSPPLTPIRTTPYLSFAATPEPGPTYTPTPVEIEMAAIEPPAVTVISDEPLLSPEILSLVSPGENSSVWVEAWPSENELVLREGGLPDDIVLRISKKQPDLQVEKGFSELSKEQVQIEQISTNKISTNFYRPDTNPTVLEQIRLLVPDEQIDYGSFSPDGNWMAWGYRQSLKYETLSIKKSGSDELPITLMGNKEYERYEGSLWSPDSSKMAYQVEVGLLTYEIRISDLNGRLIGAISPVGMASSLAWSPDGQYLAFKMTEEPQSGINHIYLVEADGSGLAQLTQHGFAEGPINWSPSSKSLTYIYAEENGDRTPWLVTIAP